MERLAGVGSHGEATSSVYVAASTSLVCMDGGDQRRCIFCGRMKGDSVDPDDPASPKVILTREHIFPASWKEKVEASFLAQFGEREFTRYRIDGTELSSRPDPLFELVVKWVCDHCNNGWMNNLDSTVEPWILDPLSDASPCDASEFRRWAIKVAVLRSYYENAKAPQPEDFRALVEGEDLGDWRIFVGHTVFPAHNHVFVGFGWIDAESGGRLSGITQVSWSIGRTFVVALRLVKTTELAGQWFKYFKSSNRVDGIVVAEVSPGSKRMPNLAFLPEVSYRRFMTLAWFFSTNALSPIADAMRGLEEGFRRAIEDMGVGERFTEL